MDIAFIYRYILDGESGAYSVTYVDGVTTVRYFDGEVGEVIDLVPTEAAAEIQVHIDSVIQGISSFNIS
jgi:hypothetical protein